MNTGGKGQVNDNRWMKKGRSGPYPEEDVDGAAIIPT